MESVQPAQQTPRISKRTIWALVLLIGPTLIGVISIIISYVITYSFPTTIGDTSPGVRGMYPGQEVFAIITGVLNTIAGITWLPGIIIGIVLLATKPGKSPSHVPVQSNAVSPQVAQQGTTLAPQYTQYDANQLAEVSSKKAKYLAWALILFIVPVLSAAICVVTFFLGIVSAFSSNASDIQTNVLSFIAYGTGVIAFFGFVPGIVIGILLLVRRSKL